MEKHEINLLIVDDEQLEINGLKGTFNFKVVGITEIYEAMNIRQAKELFLNQAIDILLCDIEMPQGNGLELIKWVKENYPATQCVCVTCHSDFDYVKRALQLGSLDYLIKPAKADELEHVILKAIENVKEAAKQLGHTQFSQLWLKHQPLILENFWKDLIKGKIHGTHEEIKRAAKEINLPELEDLMLFPILIRTQRWLRELDKKGEKQQEYQIKTLAQDMLLKEASNGVLIQLDEDGMLCLLYVYELDRMNFELIGLDCSKFIQACQEKLDCELSCYLGCSVNSLDLTAAVDQLLEIDQHNVAHSNQVLTLCNVPITTSQMNLPEMNGWAVMLENGEKERLLQELDQYQQRLMDLTDLNAHMLYQIKVDFTQLMGVYLKRNGIMAHHLFSDEASMKRFTNATRSVSNLIHWMRHDLILAMQQVSELKKGDSVIDQVKDYIVQNLDKELTCEDISAHVYLNSMYLTRIFKRETGLALSEYLLAERLKLARELLSKTSLPIHQVASKVGYSNFSHFSRMFRKHTGCTPQDYRKREEATP